MGNPPNTPNPPNPGGPPISVTPAFKLIFLSVLSLTILSLVVTIALAVFVKSPSASVQGTIDTCSTTYKMGFGAIVGLIGGKALS